MDITDIVKAVLTLAVLVVTRFVIPYINARVEAEKLATVKEWVRIAVEAAEVIYKESGMGLKKKQYVTEFLKIRGYSLDTDEIDKLIESTVHEMNAYGY